MAWNSADVCGYQEVQHGSTQPAFLCLRCAATYGTRLEIEEEFRAVLVQNLEGDKESSETICDTCYERLLD